MKKLNVSNVTTSIGQLLKSGSLAHIQESYTEMLAALLQSAQGNPSLSLTTVYVLYGCIMTGSTTIGQPFACTAGAVLYNGELFFVDAFSTGSVATGIIAKIVTTYRTATDGDPTDLTDASTVNVHEIRKIAISDGSGGIANFSAFYFFKTDDWVQLAYNTGWINGTGPSASRFLFFRKELSGFVYLRGKTVYNSGVLPVATLPAGFRPLTEFWFSAIDIGDQSMHNATVDSNGDIIIESPVATHEYTLSGIMFLAEN